MLGIAKNLGVPIEYALDEISYVNAIMYSRAMPVYGDGKRKKTGGAPLYDDALDANNPDNFEDFDDDIIVRQ